ncbi:MAG: TfoX/Sxy family DNA transformation protein [Chloroflexi bacterium]|nr:TfoX/Sxy family DNA transformation protein [Chloroflexota bacterium]
MTAQSSTAKTVSNDLAALKNIGPKSAERLRAVGIESRAQIEELGAVEVYRRLTRIYPASLTMLWALQGALMDLPFHQVPAEIKSALLDDLTERRPQ